MNNSKIREIFNKDTSVIKRFILLKIVCNNYYISMTIVRIILRRK